MISLFIIRTKSRGMNYGVGTYLTQLTSSLLKYPDITIYYINYLADKYNELTITKNKEGISNINIPSSPLIKGNRLHFLKYTRRALDIISETINNSQNVIFQVNDPTTLPFVQEIKKRWQHPIFSVIHMASWQMITIGNKQKFTKIWKNKEEYDLNTLRELLEEKEFYESVDKIVSVTDYMKKFVIEYYDIEEEKIVTIRNGIENSTTRFPDLIDKSKIKEQLGFSVNEKIVLFSGRLDNGKGLHFLLQSFNEVYKQNKNVRLVIMGEDSGTEPIRHFLTYSKDSWSKITFTGFLNYEDVLRFYQIADIGIIPSLYDHCPYVALEMMAHNIPLIISNTEGLNEMLSENQAIYLNPLYDNMGDISFDIYNMAEVILSLVYDEKKSKILTKDYVELIRTKFSVNRMASEMHKFLRSLSKEVIVCSPETINESI